MFDTLASDDLSTQESRVPVIMGAPASRRVQDPRPRNHVGLGACCVIRKPALFIFKGSFVSFRVPCSLLLDIACRIARQSQG